MSVEEPAGGPTVGVVMPVLDVQGTVAAALRALAAQPSEPAWELVVVDNGSTDATRATIRRTFAELGGSAGWSSATLVDGSSRRGVSHARNVGVERLGPSVVDVLFCDGDDEVADGWLPAMVASLRDHHLVGGALDRRRLNDPDRIRPGSERTGSLHGSVGGTSFAVGASLGLRRELFERAGGFDEDLVGGLEDADLSLRAAALGAPAAFVPSAVVHYRDREGTIDAVRLARRYGRLEAVLVDRHPDLAATWWRDDVVRHGLGSVRAALRSVASGAVFDAGARRGDLSRMARSVGRLEGELRRRVGGLTRS